MLQLCNVQIHINGQETFFLNEKIICTYSEKLSKIVKQEKRKTHDKSNNNNNNIITIEIDDFPGGPHGFELISRLCHNNGVNKKDLFTMTHINISLLYCSAVSLGMNEKAESFLEGMFQWPWKQVLSCLKSCDSHSLFSFSLSNGLLDKLIFALLAKISQTSDMSLLIPSSSSSSSSPENFFKATPESLKPCSSTKAWWFDELTILGPKIIERVAESLELYMNNNSNNNNGLTLTKFVLHYLKVYIPRKGESESPKSDFLGLVERAVNGVISMKKSFSCRSLFWVMRVVSAFGISREMRGDLEGLIGEVVDEAKLDDLLVCGNNSGVYDVSLVIRLVRVFVSTIVGSNEYDHKLKKVGKLVDKYLCEISPDHSLKVSKFLGVAESVPDLARDSFDGVYRAIDIYLESHPSLSAEERAKLCRCLNYKKLSLEACKELAKNPKIPPKITMQALISQQSKVAKTNNFKFGDNNYGHQMSPSDDIINVDTKMAMYSSFGDEGFVEQNEDVKINLQRMQRRVVELEKVCREMKGQMSKMVRQNVFGTPNHSKTPLPRLC